MNLFWIVYCVSAVILIIGASVSIWDHVIDNDEVVTLRQLLIVAVLALIPVLNTLILLSIALVVRSTARRTQ